ncbi:MAG: hypothetical protein ACRD2O_01815, partial [Terriglobia bacterium]
METTTSTVEVIASAVHLDTTTAQASTGFDQSTYSNLPLAETGEAQIFSQTINGGQTLASEVYYDGVAMLQTNVAGDYRYQPV